MKPFELKTLDSPPSTRTVHITLHLLATMCWVFAYISLGRNCLGECPRSLLEIPVLFMIGFHPGWITALLRNS